MTKRTVEIDIAKGIGIILVVYAHIVLVNPGLTIIYSFHIPLFFVLSGMVTNVNKCGTFTDLIKRKFKKMIVPYLFFCFLGIASVVFLRLCIYFLCRQTWDGAGAFFKNALYSTIWAPYSLKYFTSFNTPMWFVPCLLLVEAMYYVISRFCKGAGKYGAVLVVSVLGWVMESGHIPIDFAVLPWNFSSACFSLVFFAIGDLTFPFVRSRLLDDAKSKRTNLYCLLIFVPATLLMVFAGLLNGKVSIGSRILNNGLLFYISGISGTLAVICLARLLNRSRTLKFLGENSFTVMGIHMVIYRYVLDIFAALGKVDIGFVAAAEEFFGTTLWAVFEFVITLLLSIAFTRIYNHFLSWIKGNKERKIASNLERTES